ncbi:UNKNOWN [Stylonychia lemnae]|uniref:Uncharacterized protein n=1 Tax=Stylonychia lemnae TaxID=5949 RepID=A0A078AW41_STYLE|nr:UNKNOWN [Stylonychia lemnae]|eukprot:CDW85003.1 UNKNOWN [Stylonychia lemnae]
MTFKGGKIKDILIKDEFVTEFQTKLPRLTSLESIKSTDVPKWASSDEKNLNSRRGKNLSSRIDYLQPTNKSDLKMPNLEQVTSTQISQQKWKQTLECLNKFYLDEKQVKNVEMRQLKNLTLTPSNNQLHLDAIAAAVTQAQILEEVLSPKKNMNKIVKFRPANRYENYSQVQAESSINNEQDPQSNALASSNNQSQLGPGYYQPSYNLVKKHNPEFEFEHKTSNFHARKQSNIDHTTEVKQKLEVKQFIKSLFKQKEMRLSHDGSSFNKNSSRNSQFNTSLPWPCFRSGQPQIMPLEQWKKDMPGPGTYDNSQNLSVLQSLQKTRQFDKQSPKNSTLLYSLDSPFNPITSIYNPPAGYYFSDRRQSNGKQEHYRKAKGFLTLTQQLGDKNRNSHNATQLQEEEEATKNNEIYNFSRKNDIALVVNDKVQLPQTIQNNLDKSVNKSQDSIGPGSYNPKQAIKNKKGIVAILPFKSTVRRFASKPRDIVNVDIDLIKYSSFNPKQEQHPSPTFKSKSKRTIVFDNSNTNEVEPKRVNNHFSKERPMPEYFSISYRQPNKFVSHKELKSQQSNAPFNVVSPRFNKEDYKNYKFDIIQYIDSQKQTQEKISHSIEIRGLQSDKNNISNSSLNQSQPNEISKIEI